MSLARLHLVATALVVVVLGGLAACSPTQRPQMKVLGVERSANTYDGRQIKLFVEVTNYARRPMRLDRLQYEFGTDGAPGSRGEVVVSRTVEAGSAMVVEVPIIITGDLFDAGESMTLFGQMITEQDSIIRAYPVRAEVDGDTGTMMLRPASSAP